MSDTGDRTPHNEFEREPFEAEYGSFEEFKDRIMDYGRSFSGNRIRVGDWVIQNDPTAPKRVQIAHKDYKGNLEELGYNG